MVRYGLFEWDEGKELENIRKHGEDFVTASMAFLDPFRLIATDELHSVSEPRQFCIGLVNGDVLTVRFTIRGGRIRIFGAGRWRKGKVLYEKKKRF